MIKQHKIDEVQNLIAKLQKKSNIILTNYSGIKVKGLSGLRKKLREKNAEYKVVKNNLLRLALKETGYSNLDDYIKGPIAVAFVNEEIGEVAKIFKDFSKEEQNFTFSVGVLDNIIYNESQIKRISELPSKDVLIAQTMSLINGPARGIATYMNQIMASLARGIKAVAEVNNK